MPTLAPLTPAGKFHLFLRRAVAPSGLAERAFEAGVLDHTAAQGFCDYGHGWSGYGKCYGSNLLGADVSNFAGGFVAASLLHQDPRYFRLGNGSLAARLKYSLSRIVVARRDDGSWGVASAAITGIVTSAAVQNFYCARQNRTWGHSIRSIAFGFGGSALSNLEHEFLPDLTHRLFGGHGN